MACGPLEIGCLVVHVVGADVSSACGLARSPSGHFASAMKCGAPSQNAASLPRPERRFASPRPQRMTPKGPWNAAVNKTSSKTIRRSPRRSSPCSGPYRGLHSLPNDNRTVRAAIGTVAAHNYDGWPVESAILAARSAYACPNENLVCLAHAARRARLVQGGYHSSRAFAAGPGSHSPAQHSVPRALVHGCRRLGRRRHLTATCSTRWPANRAPVDTTESRE